MEISDRYLLEKRLGAQKNRKFGELFLAVDKQSGEKVVLKVVRLNDTESDQGQTLSAQRLRSEAQFSFTSAALPTTILFEESRSSLILVRAYREGIPLDVHWKHVKRRDRLRFLIELFAKLAPVFEQLQNEKIVHCDIKPSNILIQPVGDSFHIHLLDFGLALRTNELEENRARKLLFPLGYAAPELLLNQLDLVDQRTDLFALGIVVWRLYTEQLPLVHPNPSIFTNLQLTHPLPAHSNIPKKLQTILGKMTFKHQFSLPPNRMPASEVHDHLAQAMDQRYFALNEVGADLELLLNRHFLW